MFLRYFTWPLSSFFQQGTSNNSTDKYYVRLVGMLARRFVKFGLLHLTNSFLCVLSQALDALGETRWRLNMPVFDVIEQLWEEGGGVAHLVDASDVSKSEEL